MTKHLINGLIGATATVFVGSSAVPAARESGPVLKAARAMVLPGSDSSAHAASNAVVTQTTMALNALSASVAKLSHPKALETAFRSYFAYKSEHADDVTKPYLYFVDYGLASTEPRGYVFDMDAMTIVDGPFTVAHGRGSSTSRVGVPTRFSNASGSNATSLGLYLAENTYRFVGKTAGHIYKSVGLRLEGLSKGFNDNAFERGVVAHGAPYVTASQSGRSEGCPAMEPSRAARLLPQLANGGMVFLFAPDSNWMEHDPWITASVE